MSHSVANLEHHHFKFEAHRRPGDLHIHYFGADAFSFGDGIRLQDGDIMEVHFEGYGRALRNTVQRSGIPRSALRGSVAPVTGSQMKHPLQQADVLRARSEDDQGEVAHGKQASSGELAPSPKVRTPAKESGQACDDHQEMACGCHHRDQQVGSMQMAGSKQNRKLV